MYLRKEYDKGMPRNTEENKEKLEEKLSYLGLNLEKIPKILKEFHPFSFRPSKSYDDTSYKVYQYIPINDIQILLTPTDRLTDLNQKYKLSLPVVAYLDSKSEEHIEKFATFLTMLNNMNIEEIDKIENEQNKLKTTIPYEIKYPNNYIWQIYYSDISNQYFMLVPTNETNNNAFFYLLKKQIEASKSRKKEYIFAPVTHQEYSGQYLMQSQITDLENYLWYFTKEWPNIYEVYDVKGKMTLTIVGKTKVYKDVKSDYVVNIKSKEEALEWYKLLKALFILSTGLPNDYMFQMKISEDGGLEFWHKEDTKMEYNILPLFIKEQVENKKILVELEDKKIVEKQTELENLKYLTEKKTEEFLNKQRQISTFLTCKKSFFGKIKYYFGNRKKNLEKDEIDLENTSKTAQKQPKETKKISNQEIPQNYTIEDLIEICTKLDGRTKMVKNLEMDSKALELKKINLERKIKNANIYLNEIELHKKSIFEFWKFTSKDELPSLDEGEDEENLEKDKIKKSFVFEEDIEDLGKQADELQRRKLSKNEEDAIFAIKQAIVSSQILNKKSSKDLTKNELKILQDELDKLKQEYEENFETVQIKDFDIFGGISEDKTKVKTLHNEKHREVEKDKYKILNITPNTEVDLFIDNLRNYLKLIKEASNKINTPFEIPIYIAQKSKDENLDFKKDNIYIANLNATDELYQMVRTLEDTENLYFYTIQLPTNAPILYCTNITYFDNLNQTLPLGMDITTEVLVQLEQYNLIEEKKTEFRINYLVDEYTNRVIKVSAINYLANI